MSPFSMLSCTLFREKRPGMKMFYCLWELELNFRDTTSVNQNQNAEYMTNLYQTPPC